jgi:hypothetical protein
MLDFIFPLIFRLGFVEERSAGRRAGVGGNAEAAVEGLTVRLFV